jgi:hypothetical protein
LQRYRDGQGDLLRELANDLGWRRYGSLLCCQSCERLRELGAIAAVGAPGGERNCGDRCGGEDCCEAKIESCGHVGLHAPGETPVRRKLTRGESKSLLVLTKKPQA